MHRAFPHGWNFVSEGSSDKAKNTIENEKQVGWCDPVPGLLVFLLCGFSARRRRVINPAASSPLPPELPRTSSCDRDSVPSQGRFAASVHRGAVATWGRGSVITPHHV